ncbi:MAG: N-6 DNA methylase, partial [Acidobacteriia bacterium]|nr:N-6 DNA methylase [Terriglobia bacterium]
MAGISETETVIKKIIPYLQRRGYDLAKDLAFEIPAKVGSEARQGFVDVLVTCDRPKPVFLVEAKRDGRKITAQHRKQAVDYGKSLGCLLVAVTNGQQFELLNGTTAKPLAVNGSSLNWIPSRSDLLSYVLPQLKKDNKSSKLVIPPDRALPFRPGLPLSKLNHLISQCHNTIRKIEKDEEHAFSDFSKLLFLKLLEEKWDNEGEEPLYSYTFHELAAKGPKEADQVRVAIISMIEKIKQKTKFGAVLEDPIRLKQDATYLQIVKRLARVSFSDSDLDSKGAAFEYFVRATLRGKKLGQYFTPRPLVRLMLHMGRWRQIVASIRAGKTFKVLDPACGTGGFLVLGMKLCIAEIEKALKDKEIHSKDAAEFVNNLKQDVFFGVDANEGVACSAKMNMIVAGDGQNNIRHMDALKKSTEGKKHLSQLLVPPYVDAKGKKCNDGKAHLILSNPPFGTSESESLSQADINAYAVKSTKGQSLFIQRMIEVVDPECRIVTVIDEGVLNNYGDQELRRHILATCRIEWICSLPEETFKPNKINVKSSFIVLSKRVQDDIELKDNYPIGFIRISSLGYDGSGEDLRGFELPRLIKELENLDVESVSDAGLTSGYVWEAFRVSSSEIIADNTNRLDFRYWDPSVRMLIQSLNKTAGVSIKGINKIQTRRGNSPDASEYVSEA